MSGKKKFINLLISNLTYVYLAQGLSMLISIIFTLIIPKRLGIDGYGYWQLMVFYVNYLGIFYLGLNDGLYIRIGGLSYNKLNYSLIGSQCRIFFAIHSILSISIILLTQILVDNPDRRFVFICVAIYLPFFNLNGLLGQIFQAVNKTKIYSLSIIIDKIIILICVLLLNSFKVTNYKYYCISYISTGILISIYYLFIAWQIILKRGANKNEVKKEIVNNISIGITLMISSLASMSIVGISRLIVDFKWGISSFGLISLSFSMMNLFLVFINKSNLALFPAINGLSNKNQKICYRNIQIILDIILPLILILYIPIGEIIKLWLPKYTSSVIYLGILLPICIFDGKINLLGITYFKILQKQKQLLYINTMTFLINLIMSFIGAYVFNNITLIMISLVISMAFRSISSDFYLSKCLDINYNVNSFYLCGFSALFIILNLIDGKWLSFVIYTTLTVCYVIICIPKFKEVYLELSINLKNLEVEI